MPRTDEVAMGGYAPVDDGGQPLLEGSRPKPIKKFVIIGVSVLAVVLLVIILATTIPSSKSETGQNQGVGGNQTSPPSARPPSASSPVSAPSQGTSPTPAQTSPTPAQITPTAATPTAPPSSPVSLGICAACALSYTSPEFQIGCFVNCTMEPSLYTYCAACAAESYTPVAGSACDLSIRDWASKSCPVAPTSAPTPAPTSYIPYDPRSPSVVYGLKFLCLGDWGVTNDGDHVSTTSGKKTDPAYQRNFDAQKNVAKYMTDWAKANSPSFVLSHGDNFYWTGVGTKSDDRFRTMFEQMYSDPSLFVPWYNVLGNHDVGGGSGFCGPSCWSCGTPCDNTANMLAALAAKVNAQKNYVSPNNNRWVFEGHYYKKKHFFPASATSDATAEYSVEIFNIDTNAAGDRLPQTCCQCFGSGASSDCKNPGVGGPECVGGSVEMYQACAGEITGWWDDAMFQLERDLNNSNATWKIVHNHYLMRYHFSQPQQEQVRRILKQYQVHMFIGGHRHAEGHELVDMTHHIENGGGGGAHMAGGCGGGPAAGCIWSSTTYGFVGVKLSRYYMRLEFVSDLGTQMHCYHIPVDHSDNALNNGKWNWCT